MARLTLYSLIALAIALSACGGGGGSSQPESISNTPPPTTTSTPTPTPVPATDGNAETTRELVIDAEFDLRNTRTLRFFVDVSNQTTGFLSLCSSYRPQQESYKVDFKSCVLRTPISDGTYNGELQLSNAVDSLIGTIYSFNPEDRPVFQEFAISLDESEIYWR